MEIDSDGNAAGDTLVLLLNQPGSVRDPLDLEFISKKVMKIAQTVYFFSYSFNQNDSAITDPKWQTPGISNHKTGMANRIPEFLTTPFQRARSQYPELAGVRIRLRLLSRPGRSTMTARPTFWSLFAGRKVRTYIIRISPTVQFGNKTESLAVLPAEVLEGWFAHELGHVVDYSRYSGFGLLGFGLRYLFSPSFRRAAEFRADYHAVSNGLQESILRTKNYILHEADIPEAYKARIRRFYSSPEEIEALVQELAADS